MSSAPRFLGLVVEGPSDARTIPNVVDRILVHEVTGLEGSLKSVRTFGGLAAGSTFLPWRGVDQEAKGRVPRKHGPFSGAPAIEDARTAWYALQCFVGRDPQPDAVLLVRDSDGKPVAPTREEDPRTSALSEVAAAGSAWTPCLACR